MWGSRSAQICSAGTVSAHGCARSDAAGRSDFGRILRGLLPSHGQCDRDSADEQKPRATDEAGQLGTGAGQVAAVSGLASVRIAIGAAAVVLIAVAAAGIGVVADRELAGQFVVTAGDGDLVIADVGRGV